MKRFEQHPLYRQVIAPWYDANAVCYAVIAFLVPVLLFAIVGISVAGSHPDYHGFIWLPVCLVLMSGGIIVSTLLRLIRRSGSRYKN